MNNYQCKVCNHIYSPEEGDPGQGVEQNTAFEELPADWVCPVCGVGKGSFFEITEGVDDDGSG